MYYQRILFMSFHFTSLQIYRNQKLFSATGRTLAAHTSSEVSGQILKGCSIRHKNALLRCSLPTIAEPRLDFQKALRTLSFQKVTAQGNSPQSCLVLSLYPVLGPKSLILKVPVQYLLYKSEKKKTQAAKQRKNTNTCKTCLQKTPVLKINLPTK